MGLVSILEDIEKRRDELSHLFDDTSSTGASSNDQAAIARIIIECERLIQIARSSQEADLPSQLTEARAEAARLGSELERSRSELQAFSLDARQREKSRQVETLRAELLIANKRIEELLGQIHELKRLVKQERRRAVNKRTFGGIPPQAPRRRK